MKLYENKNKTFWKFLSEDASNYVILIVFGGFSLIPVIDENQFNGYGFIWSLAFLFIAFLYYRERYMTWKELYKNNK